MHEVPWQTGAYVVAKHKVVTEHLDPETLARWDRQRWKEDGVSSLPQGFTLRKRGREGSIYCRVGERVLELGYEISGTPDKDILVNTRGLQHWIVPAADEIPLAEQTRLRAALERWLDEQQIRALVD